MLLLLTMKLFKNPIVQTAMVVIGVMLVLPFIRPMLRNVPVLNSL